MTFSVVVWFNDGAAVGRFGLETRLRALSVLSKFLREVDEDGWKLNGFEVKDESWKNAQSKPEDHS